MNLTKNLKDKNNTETTSSNSKAFEECISILLDEIQLAIKWNRPSILVAVNTSKIGREKAKKALQRKLFGLKMDVVQIGPRGEHPDLFHFVDQANKPDQFIHFVEGIGADGGNYRTLNLYREKLVEQKVIVIFWLTEKEAVDLPRLSPDFWAFRHRVVEFAPSRAGRGKPLPVGILMWQAEIPPLIDRSIDEKIAYQQDLLHQLPSGDDAFALRAEATYALAHYHWIKGEIEAATDLLQRDIASADREQPPEFLAACLNGLAIISYEHENFDEVLERFEEAVTLEPGNPIFQVNHAVALLATGKGSQAVQIVNRAIKAAPHTWFWYIMGYVQLSLGKNDQAYAAFIESMRLNSDNISASYAIVATRIQAGQLDEQRKKLQQLDVSSLGLNPVYHAICMHALFGEQSACQEKIHEAIRTGTLSPIHIKRDPTLQMLLDEDTLEFLI